jgi:hypothetical protein
MAKRSKVMPCPECDGKGEYAHDLGGGVFLEEEGELAMRPCRICKGGRVVITVATTCADCDVEIVVTIPPKERLGERVCRDCASN